MVELYEATHAEPSTIARRTALRRRVRKLSGGHLRSLDAFAHKRWSTYPRRGLWRLDKRLVSIRGFYRHRLDDFSVSPGRVREDDPDQIKTLSTAACIRSLLRNQEVVFSNLLLDDLVYDLFSRFLSGSLGPSGLEPWNVSNCGQLLDLFGRLRDVLMSRAADTDSDPSELYKDKIDGALKNYMEDFP